nr:MAG TPA: hypothetical protein [Caudoviricetes sp.]
MMSCSFHLLVFNLLVLISFYVFDQLSALPLPKLVNFLNNV